MPRFKIDVAFVNREKEMAELRNYLEGRPNAILFLYDPVDGTYGIQGKSLEWGIKGYFEEVDILFAENAKLSK